MRFSEFFLQVHGCVHVHDCTQLNWGSSYLVEDFYRRFLRKMEAKRTT